MIGATQKSQSWERAQPPTKIAGPVLLAGLTEVLVTGMLIKWMRVNARPMLNTTTVVNPNTGFPAPTARIKIAIAAGHGTSPPDKPNAKSCLNVKRLSVGITREWPWSCS